MMDGACVATSCAGLRRNLRETSKRTQYRQRLRARAPQFRQIVGGNDNGLESEPDSADSDDADDSGDDVDSDDDDESDDEEAQPGGGGAGSGGGFVTLVPAPQTTASVGSPSENTGAPASAVAPSSTDVVDSAVPDPTGFATSTIPSADQDVLSATTLPSSAAAPSDTGSSDTVSGDFDAVSEGQTNGGSSHRGRDAGIILGTLALASLVIVAVIIFYRRRRKANGDHISRLNEKNLPDAPSSAGSDSGAGDGRGKLNSWAYFMPPDGAARDQNPPTSYYMADNKREEFSPVQEVPKYPDSPVVPQAAYGTGGRQSLSSRGSPLQQPRMVSGGGHLVPPPANLVPPKDSGDLGIYPPGQVPISQFRPQSVAQTEVTDATESTWRTWNPDQRQASRSKPWKERFLG